MENAEGGWDLPMGPGLKPCYLGVEDLYQALVNAKEENIFEYVPRGRKDNMFFMVQNDRNLQRRQKGAHSQFWDDCGAWKSSTGSSSKSVFVRLANNKLTLVVKRGDQYCLQRKRGGHTVYHPLEPQPSEESLVVAHRYYAKHTNSDTYEKRVTWLNMTPESKPIAIYEYKGIFPGLGPHGRANDQQNQYVRMKPSVMDDLRDKLKSQTPHQVFNSVDITDGPRNIRQVRDLKYIEKKKSQLNRVSIKTFKKKSQLNRVPVTTFKKKSQPNRVPMNIFVDQIAQQEELQCATAKLEELQGSSAQLEVMQCDSDFVQVSIPELELPECQSAAIDIENAVGGWDLPMGPGGKPCYLGVQDQYQTLLNAEEENIFEYVPRGRKDNMFFMVQNDRNLQRRQNGAHSQFWDDCGAWKSKGCSNKTTYVRLANNKLTQVVKRGDQYCLQRKREGHTVYQPMESQPSEESLVVAHRYYAKHTNSDTYEKRVTWLDMTPESKPIAIYEYKGIFPGLGPHGRANDQQNQYVRMKPSVMDDPGGKLKSEKPHQVFISTNITDGPKHIKEENQREKEKSQPNKRPTTTFTEQIDQLGAVQWDPDFAQVIIKRPGKEPCIILYKKEQMADIKFE